MKPNITLVVLLTIAGAAFSQELAPARSIDSVQTALDRAPVRAGSIIKRFGETDSALMAMQELLEEIAALPGIKSHATMKELHGSKTMSRGLLAKDSASGICLYLSWFGNGATTPVHDHLTWGAIRVLEGHDRYVKWERRVSDRSDEVQVTKGEDRVLGPGESVFWLGPPHDTHSQAAVDGDVWELVLTGRDLASDYVAKRQHRFDPKSGRLITTTIR